MECESGLINIALAAWVILRSIRALHGLSSAETQGLLLINMATSRVNLSGNTSIACPTLALSAQRVMIIEPKPGREIIDDIFTSEMDHKYTISTVILLII